MGAVQAQKAFAHIPIADPKNLANAHAIGVRGRDALYRFMRGFGKPVIAAHHLFAADADVDPGQARQAWEAWLSRTLT